jgi:aromatic-L-amino-acid/L-tryptophan decarboxylase
VLLFRRHGWEPEDYHRWWRGLLERQLAFVQPTWWDGEQVARLCFVNPRTALEHVLPVLDAMR